MNKLIDACGVKAIVYLLFDDSIHKLATKLSKELSIPDFDVDTDMDPPHDEFAMGETLGIEIWLNKSDNVIGFNYELKIESSTVNEDKINFNLQDISTWLAKYTNTVCHLKTGISTINEEFIIFDEKDD